MGIFIAPQATTAERTGIIPAAGELIHDTDQQVFSRGDDVTQGGVILHGGD